MLNLRLLILPILLLNIAYANSQSVTADTIANRLSAQTHNFPQEKIYVMTDREQYFGGDTIWLRAFVTDASNNRPVTVSKYVYLELTNPFDTLVTRVKIIPRSGVYCGYIPLNVQIPDGEYMLTAYTMFMKNVGTDFFFRKNITVSSPYSIQSKIRPDFIWDNDVLKAKVSYIDKQTGKIRNFDRMNYITCEGKTYERINRGGGIAEFELSGSELSRPYVLVSFGEHYSFLRLPDKLRPLFDVTFYPEGGYLIPGKDCRVAFKAVDTSGSGINITGEVKDANGRSVSRFETLHNGMGVFTIKPFDGEKYTAEVSYGKNNIRRFNLPDPYVNASALNITSDKDSFIVKAIGCVPKNSFIVIQQSGLIEATAPIDSLTPQRFSKSWFKTGVQHVLLLDSRLNTLSERLFFIYGKSRSDIDMVSDKDSYGNREILNMSLKLKGICSPASLAISVTDDKMAPLISTTSIESQLLLQGDLAGQVEQPAFYFDKANKHAEDALDVLMLTQGWRRYDIPSVIRGIYTNVKVPIELSQEIDGIVNGNWSNKPVKGATVSVIAPKVGYTGATTTDDKGIFRLNGFDFPDSTDFVMQAVNREGRKMMNINLIEQTFPQLSFTNILSKQTRETYSDFYEENNKQRIKNDMSLQQILLEEVTVIGRRQRSAGSIYSSLSSKSFNSKYMRDNHISTLDELVRLIPGVTIRNDNLYYRNALVAMAANGVIEEYPNGMSPFKEMKAKYNIDVVKGVDFIPSYKSAVIFGTHTADGGVLNITTKNGSEIDFIQQSPYLKVIVPLGYQKPVEFYSPRYKTSGKVANGTDLRSTICWLPDIKTSDNGEASFSFYTSDNPNTHYTIRVEGLTEAGEIVLKQCKIEIE